MNDHTNSNRTISPGPQFHVRTGLRSGNALDKCQQEVAGLQKHYQQLSAEAHQRGISVS
jgi:hypothetical protein